MNKFKTWLCKQGYDLFDNAGLSLGYLPLGKVNLKDSFGDIHFHDIIDTMGDYLDIYKVEIDDVSYNICNEMNNKIISYKELGLC
jgi:hypothetical protein